MRKRILLGLVVVSLMSTSMTAFAEPLSTQQQQEIQDKASEYNKITNQVESTEDEVYKLSNDIGNLMREIIETTEKINQIQKNCDYKNQELQEKVTLFSDRLRNYYKEGSNLNKTAIIINIVFNSENLSQIFREMSAMKKMTDIDKKVLNEIKEDKEKLEESKDMLETLQDDNKEKSDKLDSQKKELETKLESLKDQQSKTKSNLMETERGIVNPAINIINTSSLSSEIQQAINTLRNIRGSLVSDTVENEVVEAIERGKIKITNSGTNKASSRGASSVASSNEIVLYSYQFLGIPYVWGGENPSGFDCSGFVSYVYAHFGYNIGRTTYNQIKVGVSVSISNLQPGDLVFFGKATAPHHVGMYIGEGKYIHSPHTGDVVKISSNIGSICAARRII